MSTTTNVQQVKVNIMTQQQYDTATKNPNEFYVISDAEYLEGITSADVTAALGYTPASEATVAGITTLIPSAATSSNQLADQSFVNSSIATNTANFIGTFNSLAELNTYSGTKTNNDYAFVATTDTAGNTLYDRYKYVASTSTWTFEYELNNSSFTSGQWAAINSGVTSDTKVTHTASTAVGNTITPVYISSTGAAAALSYTIAKSVPSDAKFTDTTYATTGTVSSGSASLITSGGVYTAISGKQDSSTAVTHAASTAVGNSTVPVYVTSSGAVATCAALNTAAYVSDSTLAHLAGAETFTGNKTFSGSVSLGSSASATTPSASDNSTKVATTKFVKDQGYITGINSSMVTTALGYTPYNSTNPSGYITGITSSMVTTALGYTPANASNVQTVQDIAPISATSGTVSQTVTDSTSMYQITPSGDITSFSFDYTGTDDKAYTFELLVDMSTSTVYAINWVGITWMGNEIPDMSETGTYFLAFRKIGTGGWLGNLQGKW